MWEEFVNFYIFIYYIITLLEHVINTFPNLLHFLDYWDVYRKKKGIPLVGQEHTPPSSWSWDSKDSKLPIKWRGGCRSRKTLK